jgi:RNA polymerase sigma factor (sigma-70 family)
VADAAQNPFEDLLGRYLPALRRLAWSYARDGTEGEDLFQEIAMALWRAHPGFRNESSERTWVYRVAHNTAITFVTRQRKRKNRERSAAPETEPAARADPEGDAIEQQRQQRLWTAVQELPVADRRVILLYLEGLSAAEIESITGLTAGNVATRLTRIRQRLAARVRGEEGRK